MKESGRKTLYRASTSGNCGVQRRRTKKHDQERLAAFDEARGVPHGRYRGRHGHGDHAVRKALASKVRRQGREQARREADGQ